MKTSNTSNGRINLVPTAPNIQNLFAMYDKIPANQSVTFRESVNGIWSETTLSTAFFSLENMQIIQNGIRKGVYEKSQGRFLIAPQDVNSLKVIMRSIFLQNSSNQNVNIVSQIKQLNDIVLKYCVEQVYGEAQGYMNYLRDVSSAPEPMAPPVMDYTESRRTHKMNPWF
jgi:hypothetical protein